MGGHWLASQWWFPCAKRKDQAHRPRRLILVRHGESEANVDRKITSVVPDHSLHLTKKGREDALEAGNMLRRVIGSDTVEFLVSPYVRTWETFSGIAQAWGGTDKLPSRSEILVREQDFGNFDKPDMGELHKEKKDFGQFYYRFPEGESPADLYSRASTFLETLYRRWEHSVEDNLVIVSHRIFLTVFMMRFFRFTLEEYYNLAELKNCEVVVLERPKDSFWFQVAYTWFPGGEEHRGGLRKLDKKQAGEQIWNGDPDQPMIRSLPRRAASFA